MAQPETGGVRTTEDEGEELETPSDDEEIKIPSQDNDGIRKVDVRSEQLENTQREDWLLPTESRHGFDGTTSWEQYHQVFEAIVRSNGWDNDTAALQLFSHLEGDALNVAHLVPLARRLSQSGLVDALTAHYGSPGRLADYRRQFERTTRKVGEDPAIFATVLETLAVKAFGDMGQTARLRLIRDRFVAGHDNCDLRRHLDSVPPETSIRDVVDRCRVWESHADPIARRTRKPTPDMTYPTYAVGDADKDREVIKVAAVTGVRSDQNQLHDLLRRIVSAVERPTPAPEISDVKKLLLQLSRAPPEGPAPVVDTPVPPTLLCRRHSCAADTGTNIARCPRWTTPTATTAPKTATTSETTANPEGLVRCNLFLLREGRSCSNTLSGL